MPEGNGYNVSDDGRTVVERLFFVDVCDRKQTSVVKVSGELVRVPDEIRAFFDVLRISDQALAEQLIKQYKMVRKYLDFVFSAVDLNLSLHLPMAQFLAILDNITLQGRDCDVQIGVHFLEEKRIGIVVRLYPKNGKKISIMLGRCQKIP